jgi:hypothetical protein
VFQAYSGNPHFHAHHGGSFNNEFNQRVFAIRGLHVLILNTHALMPAALACVIDDVFACPFHNFSSLQTALQCRLIKYHQRLGHAARRVVGSLPLSLVASLQTASAALVLQTAFCLDAGGSAIRASPPLCFPSICRFVNNVASLQTAGQHRSC